MLKTIYLDKLGTHPDVLATTLGKENVAAALRAEPFIDYAVMLKEIVSNPPREGFDVPSIKRATEICALLDHVVKEEISTFTMSAEHYSFIMQRLAMFRWAFPHQHIVKFITDLEECGHGKD